ncbi:cobyric acid synthase [Halococcus agarilyticus]|uniref:cobyric acid synthase n=1 Tax=Halococcus agarilyticus TaxID=1232219 RepID=UPI0006780B6F|nr:cobyric acid synthase [Halococcus agarilyticus]
MTSTVLVAGTASHVGKSTVVTGLCRRLAREGVAVAPYKAQNMSNNARAVVTADGVDGTKRRPSKDDEASTDGWGEIGVSQYVQARAAGVTPTTDMNPVLLKPRGDAESQLVIDGRAVGHYAAGAYYDEHWERAREAAEAAHDRLAAEYEVIVAEGAGSIAEINLHDRDLANVATARFADASILLLADIERGGAFASAYGTLELMPDDLRERVMGVVFTKFRGDRSILESGIEELERKTGIPVLDILPYDDPGLPAEDSVSLPAADERRVLGDDDGVADEGAVTVAVPRLPRISNFTDLEPLAREPGVRVSYVPLDTDLVAADAVVIPGTKNTVDDLLALRETGFDEALARVSGPIVGLCGGYQILGERITNAAVEGTGDRSVVEGLRLLPVETRFSPEKRVECVTREVDGSGPIAGASGPVSGYEIHMGETAATAAIDRPLGEGSAAIDRVLGTYLHGLFENANVRDAFVDSVFHRAGKRRPRPADVERSPYAKAAELVDGLALGLE